MALFSKKTELELVLESRQVVAGQTVRAQVSTGEPDGKIHCSRLELLYRNTYRVEVHDGVSKGTKDVIVESHPLPGGVTGNHSVELTVPSNAPGSSAGSVEWMVRAAKDRRMARDLSRTVPITVLVPAEPLACLGRASAHRRFRVDDHDHRRHAPHGHVRHRHLRAP